MAAPQHDPRSPFSRVGAFVFSADFVLGVLALLFSSLIERDEWWVLAPFCVSNLLLHLYLLYRSLRVAPASLLYEAGIFMVISCGIYFSFGPLLHVFGPMEAAFKSRAFYPLTAPEAVWLTGMNFVGVGLAGLVYVSFRLRGLATTSERASRSWSRYAPTLVFLVFVTIGIVAKYVFVVPFELSLTTSVPSSIMRQLGRLLVIALIVGWAYRRTGPWWMAPLAVVVTTLEFTTGLLMFNKTETLLSVFAAGLGDYLARRNAKVLIAVAAAAITLYVLVTPIATFGRNELISAGGGDEPMPATLSQRMTIVLQYFEGGETHRREPEEPGRWWRRLDYLPTQQAAVDLYARGKGGDDFARLPWLVVPRTIYPDKPEMTVAGKDLTQKVTGSRNSANAVGVFIDGYYNLGWLGFLITSVTFGLALRIYANIAEPVVRQRALAMYPLVFMGIYAGIRADGWWLADVAGPLVFVLVALTLFRIFSDE